MILPDFKAFPRMGRIIGLDWGARRTGVAVTDASRQFFFTRPVLTGELTPARVVQIATDEGAAGIIIGLPLHADGTPSETTAMVRKFADALARATDLPICFIEENLTSVAAEEFLGRMTRRDVKEKLDSEAARVILENAVAMINRA